ncbi:MAG: nuclear transport factor 2 family protein [Pseudomonadales bacterium]|nr:nuclear transport factor 2 family protein [Pseudomonadales bacterium]
MKLNTVAGTLLMVVFCSVPQPGYGQGSAYSAIPSIELPSALDRVLRDYETAWAAGNADALAQLFTEDGFVLSGGSPPARGRAAIRERYVNAGGPLLLRAFAYEMDGSLAYIFGAYTYTEGTDQGKFVLTLKEIEGRWLITSDQDNPMDNQE